MESIKEKNVNFLVESTISEMKYVSDRISGRLDSEEKNINNLEGALTAIQSQDRKRRKCKEHQ